MTLAGGAKWEITYTDSTSQTTNATCTTAPDDASSPAAP